MCIVIHLKKEEDKFKQFTYHKCEWPGGQGSVVINTVPHTHLNLSFLNPVACGVIQQTYNSVNHKVRESLLKLVKLFTARRLG